MEFREDLLDRLCACLKRECEWHRVERCFHEGLDPDDEDVRPVVWAFGYMLIGDRRKEARERSGVFAPMIVRPDGSSFPPPLDAVRDEVAPVWASYAEALGDHPLGASRLRDLLWVARIGDRSVDHARAAVDAYLSLTETMETMNLVDCLSRAIEIASEIGDDKRIAAGVQRAIEEIEAELALPDEDRPGIPMSLLESIAALKPERRPQNLIDLIKAAGTRYEANPWIAQSVSDLLATLSGPEERAVLAAEQVERWRDEAQKCDGLLRYAHLQHALGIARKHGLGELAKAILVELQSITPEDLDPKTISTEVTVPREKIDPYIKSFGEHNDWRAALTLLGATGVPVGAEPVQQSADEFPLSRLFPVQVLGAQSSLVFGAAQDKDHDRLDASRKTLSESASGARSRSRYSTRSGTPSPDPPNTSWLSSSQPN